MSWPTLLMCFLSLERTRLVMQETKEIAHKVWMLQRLRTVCVTDLII
jgi:hypothetical protein